MKTTARDRLQLGGWVRMAAALAILTVISIAPLYTGSRAIPGLADAPVTEQELPATTASAQVAPAEPVAKITQQ
jgi:hypothetical protein